MDSTKPIRIVGIAVSKKNLGFCVLEQPDFLLDWGVKRMKDRKSETIEKILSHIFDFYQANYLSLEDISHPACKLSKENIFVVRKFQKIAESKNIPVHAYSWGDIKLRVGFANKDNTDMVTQAVVKRIPALSTMRLPVRKAWQSECRAKTLCKAVALAYVF